MVMRPPPARAAADGLGYPPTVITWIERKCHALFELRGRAGGGHDLARQVAGDAALVVFADRVLDVGVVIGLGQRVIHRRQRFARRHGRQAGGLQRHQRALRRGRRARATKAHETRQVGIQAVAARAEHEHGALANRLVRRRRVAKQRQAPRTGHQHQRRVDAAAPQRLGASAGQLLLGPVGPGAVQHLGHRFGRFTPQQAVARLLGVAQHQLALAERQRQRQFVRLRAVRQHRPALGRGQHEMLAQLGFGPWLDMKAEPGRYFFEAQALAFDLVGQHAGVARSDQHFGNARVGGVQHGA
jgi:hypothetical protein